MTGELSRRRVCAGLLLSALSPAAKPQPHLPWAPMLAQAWKPGVELQAYVASEKFDGVRALWDGAGLWTRQGGRIAAPAWFTQGWPAVAMDGELWAGRGGFEHAQSTAARDVAPEAAWRRLRYLVFDLPREPGPFSARLARLHAFLPQPMPEVDETGTTPAPPYLQRVVQRAAGSEADLKRTLHAAVAQGAEGLMLHRLDSLYAGGRGSDLLKVKLHEDAEAEVLAILPGKGRLAGLMGALLVRTEAGARFRLGAGFSDAVRRSPPPIGSRITFRYRGLNANGLPRFATFLRVRLL